MTQPTMISIQDEGLEITYFDESEVGSDAVLLHNILIKKILIQEEVEQLEALVNIMIRVGKDNIRNPVDSFSRAAI